jgi:hypothetical protein
MNPILYKILKSNSIEEYLSSIGKNPYKNMSGNRLAYLCPFDDHKETKPSFILWKDDIENFYCFGCGRGYNIIHMVSFIENISLKEAFKKLSKGLNDSIYDNLVFMIKHLENKNPITDTVNKLYADLLCISNLCLSYIKNMNNDVNEIKLIDALYSEVDKNINNYDFDNISLISKSLPDILIKRIEKIKGK